MRTLFEIIDGAKSGKIPTHDECYWAMLALSALHHFDHMDLIRLTERGDKVRPEFIKWHANESLRRLQTALNKSPKDWVGPDDDPSNPDVQKRRELGLKILKKFIPEDHRGE